MACPYFMPTVKLESGTWMHPARLPLGTGWMGHCCAPGHEQAEPTQDELREFCNLGYARCSRLPQEHAADAVRFSITRHCGDLLTVMFVFELGHRPAEHGTLELDTRNQRWITVHPNPRIQRMAECFVESHMLRHHRPEPSNLPEIVHD